MNATLSVTLDDHAYDEAPLPKSVTAFPSHTALADVFAVTAGNAFTLSVTVDVFEHPGPLVPVTVYVVVAVGFTVTEEPLRLPGIHVYEEPPFAFSVALSPSQIAGTDEDEVMVGSGPTVTITVCVPVQPLPAVPVTV